MSNVVLGGGEHAAWYEAMPRLQRKLFTDRVVLQASDVANELSGELRIPSKTIIRFVSDRHSDDETLAYVYDGRIVYIGSLMLEYADCIEIMAGAIGHEFSHLSDNRTKNRAAITYNLTSRLVSEGKAEEIGCMFGGSTYKNELCAGDELPVSRAKCVKALAMDEARGSAAIDEMGGEYWVGHAFVQEALHHSGKTIYEAHSRQPEFFVDQFLAAG